MELSKRLQAVADLLEHHEFVADIGCDHGFVSIYLIESKKASHCLAMDINKGPLERAREHVYEKGLSTYIETRLSNGAEKLQFLEDTFGNRTLEVQAALMAGMGGRLMIRIVQDSLEKFLSMEEFVMQPQSEIGNVRRFIRTIGCHIVTEDMILEDGKFYPMMKVVPGEKETNLWEKLPESIQKKLQEHTLELSKVQQLMDEYGEFLLKEKNPVLEQYLKWEKKLQSDLLITLEKTGTAKADLRKREVEEKIDNINLGLEWFTDEM